MTAQDIESVKRALFQAWCHQYAGRASCLRLHAAMDAAVSVLPAWQVDAIMDAATRATEAHRKRAYQRTLRRISLSTP